MLTKDISVKAATFRREGFKKFAEVSMSRRYIKNALFLFLFACLTITVYTVFLNVKRGAKSGNMEGFVQNMVVDVPHDHKQDSDKFLDESKNGLVDNGRNLEEDILQPHDSNRNDLWPAEGKDFENKHNQDEDVGHEDDQGGAFDRDEDGIPINNEIDSRDDKDGDYVVEASDEKDEDVRIPRLDPEEVRVRDEEGNIVGYKLFPHGIHPDHNKPPEERERELRRRLGLPPKEVKRPKEEVPEIRKELQEPNVLPRRKIINAGGEDKKPYEPAKEVDDLGAFHLKDRVPNKVDGFLRRDDFKDEPGDGFAIDKVEDDREHYRGRLGRQNQLDDDTQVDDIVLDDRFVDRRNPPLARHDNRLQPDNRARHIFPPRDSFDAHNKAYPDRFAPRNDMKDSAKENVNPNRYGNANLGAIIRPIGNNGINPFHVGQQGGRDRPNAMPDRMLNRGGMAPFANNRGMPDNHLQKAPMYDNRMAPFQGAVPNDGRAMDPFGQQNEGLRHDPFQNAPSNKGGMDAFGRNQERMNDPIPGDSRGRNPFLHRDEGVREDLLDKARLSNEDRNPFAQEDSGNKNDVMLPAPMNDGINPGLELPQGGEDSLTDDEIKEVEEGNSNSNTIEGKPPPVLNQMPVEENDEPERPLDIKDISKPLPVSFDCVPFVFPPKEGTLCVHEPEHDKALSGVIKTTGIWEPAMLAGFFALLKAHPELNVVDIGAGIGVYTITAAMMDRKVVAVEPLYLNYRMLHKSALENEVSDKITLVAQAIGSKSYLGHLNYSDETGGYSQVHIDRISSDQANADSSDVVQVTTLNNLVQALPFDSAVLKVDVGGVMEPEVLASSSKFFQALRVPYVLTHWNFHTGVMKKIQVATLLRQKGYHPRTEWNGNNVDPNVLQQDLEYLIWAL